MTAAAAAAVAIVPGATALSQRLERETAAQHDVFDRFGTLPQRHSHPR